MRMHEFRLHPGEACQPHCHTRTECNHAIKLAVENTYGPLQPPAFNLCCICPKALREIFQKSCKIAHLKVRKEIAGPTDLQKLECRAQPQQRGQYASTFRRQPCAPSHSACQRQSLAPFQRQHLAPSKALWSWLSFSRSGDTRLESFILKDSRRASRTLRLTSEACGKYLRRCLCCSRQMHSGPVVCTYLFRPPSGLSCCDPCVRAASSDVVRLLLICCTSVYVHRTRRCIPPAQAAPPSRVLGQDAMWAQRCCWRDQAQHAD